MNNMLIKFVVDCYDSAIADHTTQLILEEKPMASATGKRNTKTEAKIEASAVFVG